MTGLSLNSPGLSLTGKLSIPPGLSLSSSSTAMPASGLSLGGGPTTPAGTFFAAVTSAGGTVSVPRQAIYTTLFNSLTSAGLMTKIQRLGIMAAEDAPSCKVDLIDPTKQLIFVGAPTFTANQGVISLGSTNYVDTNFAAPSALFTQDSAFDMVGTLSTRAVGADNALLGNAQLVGGSAVYGLSSGSTTIGSVNNSGVFNTNWASAGSIKGLYINTRRGAAASENYKNGVSVNTSGQASAAPVTLNFLIGCWRNTDGTTVYAFDGGIVSCWAVGTSLSAADVTALTNAVNAYMTSVGNPLF